MGACCTSARASDVATPARITTRGTVLARPDYKIPKNYAVAAELDNNICPQVSKATSKHSDTFSGSGGEDDACDMDQDTTVYATSTGSNASESLLTVEEFRRRVCAQPATSSSQQVKVMTYNLHWWSLFGFRGGNRGSASKLVRCALPDIVGFQECEDVSQVLSKQGLANMYSAVQGPHSLAVAYKISEWSLAAQGCENVAEDEEEQYSGSRGVHWVRLVHTTTGKAVFFMNHFGPLRMNSGGKGGGAATAAKIANAIYRNLQLGDGAVLLGTFNATAESRTIRTLEQYLPKAWTGRVYDGIDHCFSPQKVEDIQLLGKGGSDHDAVVVSLSV